MKRSPERRSIAATALLALTAALACGNAPAAPPATGKQDAAEAAAGPQAAQAEVPFVVGLTTVYAVSEPQGDYESLHTVVSIGKDGYRLRVSAQTPGSDRPDNALRIVARDDQAYSHRVRDWFSADDHPLFPDTVPGFSREMLNYLALGDTHMAYLEIESGFVKSSVHRSLSGTLRLVGDGPETLPMLVNGRMADLPVLHARGTLGDAEGSVQVEYYVLADEDNPLVLKAVNPMGDIEAVRIEYPVAGSAPDSIERQLARHEKVAIHSIYFAFARADILPESRRVLKEIAGILRGHPGWKLAIAGHTDAIGNDEDNLALSRRRAEAVKAALVADYGIAAARLATAGHGESQPSDENDSAEGRSHNRRVELSRQ